MASASVSPSDTSSSSSSSSSPWARAHLRAYAFAFVLLLVAIVVVAATDSVAVDVAVTVLFCVMVAAAFGRAAVLAHQRRQRQRYSALSQQDEGAAGGARREAVAAAVLMHANPTHLRLAMMDRDFDANDYDTLMQLDAEDDAVFQGLRADEIDQLPVGAAKGGKLTCAVCLEKVEDGAPVRTLPCLHRFDRNCIDQWLRTKAMCPVCMFSVTVR